MFSGGSKGNIRKKRLNGYFSNFSELYTTVFYIQVEKNVEKIKMACTTTSKKLNMCMLSSGPDAERRKVGFPGRIY